MRGKENLQPSGSKAGQQPDLLHPRHIQLPDDRHRIHVDDEVGQDVDSGMDGVEDLQIDARASGGILDLGPEVVDGQALHDEGRLEDERPDDNEGEERPDPSAAEGRVREYALVEEQDRDFAEAEVGEVEELEGVERLVINNVSFRLGRTLRGCWKG